MPMIPPLFRCLLLYLCLTQFSRGTVWQFATELPDPVKGRAFLWIPPDCPQLRGIILAQQTILEKTALEDPVIRSTATASNLGIVIFCPAAFSGNDFTAAGTGRKTLDATLSSLASISGYPELKTAPFLTIGHSGGAIFAWHAAYAQPERCLGVIGLHAHPIPPPADQPSLLLEGVPVLTISGQYETWGQQGKAAESHWHECRDKSLAFRRRSPKCLMSVLVQPGTTHFNWDPPLARYTADFIARATQLRLPAPDSGPATNPPRLREIPPNSGWLTSPALIDLPEFPAAAAADYKGPPTETFWHPDKETASASESFCRSARGKLPQFLSLAAKRTTAPLRLAPQTVAPHRSRRLHHHHQRRLPHESSSGSRLPQPTRLSEPQHDSHPIPPHRRMERRWSPDWRCHFPVRHRPIRHLPTLVLPHDHGTPPRRRPLRSSSATRRNHAPTTASRSQAPENLLPRHPSSGLFNPNPHSQGLQFLRTPASILRDRRSR